MPRIQGTTNAQSAFLRTFINKPTGPDPEDWPRPALLRRWLRRENFRKALQSLLTTLSARTEPHF